jgi:hypothetical protein
LGHEIYNQFYLENQCDDSTQKKELEAMGFDLSFQKKAYCWVNVKLALESYKKLHGNLLVPFKFVVTANDITWPRELWNIRLGRIFSDIRCQKASSGIGRSWRPWTLNLTPVGLVVVLEVTGSESS